MDKVKVLITGPVNGSFEALNTKLKSLSKSKAGPFHICFCAGAFFQENAKISETELLLKEGTPLPVYFCDIGSLSKGIELPSPPQPENQDSDEISLGNDDVDNEESVQDNIVDNPASDGIKNNGIVKIAPNLYHLQGMQHDSRQTADILNIDVKDCKGYITVAFVPPKSRIDTAQTAKLQTKTRHPSYLGCDILLTSEWGQGIANSSCFAKDDIVKLKSEAGVDQSQIEEIGSYDVAEIASQCKPRYHFAPSTAVTEAADSENVGLFLQSLPYANPPSALASGLLKNYHTSRFLVLCPVTDAKTAKKGGKMKKFIHALGVQPLWSMDRVTATAVPEGVVVVPSPYTDSQYAKDSVDGVGSGKTPIETNVRNAGLSEAQTRRILSEDANGDQYRWNLRKRSNERVSLEHATQQNQIQIAAANDPDNCTLFLYGIHKDSSNGQNVNQDSIFKAFQSHGCVKVQYPGTGDNNQQRTVRFCFLHFTSHSEAERCLQITSGQIEISGILLTLKWSSGSRGGQFVPPPPPPGHAGIYAGIPPPSPPQKRQKRERLTEAEAADSSTLFTYINAQTLSSDDCIKLIQSVGGIAQAGLEEAINNGVDGVDESSCITAEDEPALKVTTRHLETKSNCGFLDFASHAAASMAVATLTGSTDGGVIAQDKLKGKMNTNESWCEVQLWWSKPKDRDESLSVQRQKKQFQVETRKDCWFCLASPACEKHLIVTILDTCYITMPKGPVNEHHTLIVPVNHSSSGETEGDKQQIVGAFLDPTPGLEMELENTKSKLRVYAHEVLQKDLFVFERAFPTRGGYHAHVNCVPIERGLGSKIRSTMMTMVRSVGGEGFSLQEIQTEDMRLSSILRNAQEDGDLSGYFYVEVPVSNNGEIKRFLYKARQKEQSNHGRDNRSPIRVPLQFGREILADVLGDNNLGDWKACTVSKEKEDEWTQSFRASFGKFKRDIAS